MGIYRDGNQPGHGSKTLQSACVRIIINTNPGGRGTAKPGGASTAWQPNLSSQHCALAVSETDATLMFKRRATILILSPGGVGGLCQQQETAQKALPKTLLKVSAVLSHLIHPWVT